MLFGALVSCCCDPALDAELVTLYAPRSSFLIAATTAIEDVSNGLIANIEIIANSS